MSAVVPTSNEWFKTSGDRNSNMIERPTSNIVFHLIKKMEPYAMCTARANLPFELGRITCFKLDKAAPILEVRSWTLDLPAMP